MVVPLLLALAQMPSSSELRRNMAAGDKDAFLMMPPETVCGGEVQAMIWTGDGSHLVVRRTVSNVTAADIATFGTGARPTPEDQARMQPRIELDVWSPKTHKLRVVAGAAQDGKTIVGDPDAMPGSDRVIFSTYEEVAAANGGPPRRVVTLLMLAAGSGTLTRLGSHDEDGPMGQMVSLSPIAPLGVIETIDRTKPTWTVRFFGPNGVPGAGIEIPAASYVGFNDSGAAGYSFVMKEGGKPVARFQTIDPATGRLGAILAGREAAGKAKPGILTTTTGSVGSEVDAPTIFLNVVGGKREESGIVTTDGVKPLVSPKLDAVAYVAQGNAMVRTMARVPRAAFDQARLAAERTVALSKAKQVGLGLIMVASDMDDKLPGQGTDLHGLLGPYLKNDKLLDGFNYTFGGGNMADVDKPAETEMGSVAGPGGRAVVYVDGHAKWIPDGK